MASILIKGCTVEDTDALETSNILLARTHVENSLDDGTLDFMVQEMTKKLPIELLKDPETSRHEMAVDGETGAIMGYICCAFPEGVLNGQQQNDVKWKLAQAPRVSDKKLK